MRNNKPDEISIERLVAIETGIEQLRAAINETGSATTAELAALRGLSQNGVLWAGTVRLGPDGHHALRLAVPAGTIVIEYQPEPAVGVLLVTSGDRGAGEQPNMGTAGGGFEGVFRFLPNTLKAVPLLASTVSCYGAAGAYLHVELWARSMNPAAA